MSNEDNTPATIDKPEDMATTRGKRRCCGNDSHRRCGPRRWIKLAVVLAIIGAAVAWHYHRHHDDRFFSHNASPAAVQQRAEWVTARLADKVDATAAQRTQLTVIGHSVASDLEPLIAAHRAARASLYTALSADTVDAAQLEQLRSEMVQRIDATSRSLTGSLVEMGKVLSVEQRRDLVARWAPVL